MSTIQIQCINKTLTIIDSPSIEIGGVNSLQFSFCPLWDGYSKTVHFYKNETDCNPVEIVNNLAEIPSNLISEGASFFFFVEGISGELKRRSQIFKCKIESSLLVVENADTDIQLRLIDLIENIDTSFDYSDMTDEDKLKLREGLSAYQKKFTYHLGLSAGISSFTLPDENYREGADIVNIHLNGIYLHEGLDYTLSGRIVTLTNTIVYPSVAEVSIIRAVIINSNDYSLLKGDKGDQGIQGIQGIQGEKGDKGDKGDAGEPINTVNYPLTGNSGTVYISANVGRISNGQGLSVIVQSRGGETVWVNCTSTDSSFLGYAIRMSNTYGKTAGIWYDQTTGYLYTQQNAWSNLVSFTVIATTFSIRQPTVAQVSSIPSTATQITITDIALKSDLSDITSGKLTTNWSASQESSGNLVFTYA